MTWINIDDQLPKEGQKVIYYFEKTGVDRGYFTQYFFKEGGKINTFYGNGWLSDDVTHWMPDEGQALPEPPKTKPE